MTVEAAVDHAAERPFRTPRQDDGMIYKAMAFVIFAIFGLPIGYRLSLGLPAAGGLLLVPAAVFLFCVSYDVALLGLGRRDMLLFDTPRLIFARALQHATQFGLVLLACQLPQQLLFVGFGLFLARTLAHWLTDWPSRNREVTA